MHLLDMGYSGQQVRSLLRLSGRLRDADSTHQLWQSLLGAMCQATQAVSAYGLLLDANMNHASDVELTTIRDGEPQATSGSQLDFFLTEAEELFRPMNPMSGPFLELFSNRKMKSTAVCRTELVPDSLWYPSEFYMQYRQPAGLDDCILSVVPLSSHAAAFAAVVLNRSQAESDLPHVVPATFSDHDCCFAELIHSELSWACAPDDSYRNSRNRHSKPIDPIVDPIEVAPRLRRVLDRLLEGDSEKQIAKSLSLSRHTIHEYIRALYRELGVSSRSELMARFVSASR